MSQIGAALFLLLLLALPAALGMGVIYYVARRRLDRYHEQNRVYFSYSEGWTAGQMIQINCIIVPIPMTALTRFFVGPETIELVLLWSMWIVGSIALTPVWFLFAFIVLAKSRRKLFSAETAHPKEVGSNP